MPGLRRSADNAGPGEPQITARFSATISAVASLLAGAAGAVALGGDRPALVADQVRPADGVAAFRVVASPSASGAIILISPPPAAGRRPGHRLPVAAGPRSWCLPSPTSRSIRPAQHAGQDTGHGLGGRADGVGGAPGDEPVRADEDRAVRPRSRRRRRSPRRRPRVRRPRRSPGRRRGRRPAVPPPRGPRPATRRRAGRPAGRSSRRTGRAWTPSSPRRCSQTCGAREPGWPWQSRGCRCGGSPASVAGRLRDDRGRVVAVAELQVEVVDHRLRVRGAAVRHHPVA